MNKPMKQCRFAAIAAVILVGLLSVGVFPAGAEELVVEQATISADVADREPVDPEQFSGNG